MGGMRPQIGSAPTIFEWGCFLLFSYWVHWSFGTRLRAMVCFRFIRAARSVIDRWLCCCNCDGATPLRIAAHKKEIGSDMKADAGTRP